MIDILYLCRLREQNSFLLRRNGEEAPFQQNDPILPQIGFLPMNTPSKATRIKSATLTLSLEATMALNNRWFC